MSNTQTSTFTDSALSDKVKQQKVQKRIRQLVI